MEARTILTLLCILFLTCAGKKEYRLTGTFAQPGYDGTTVYMFADEDRQNLMDSAVVINNQFVFKGVSPDSIQTAYVSYKKNRVPDLVIIEQGNITMTIDTAFHWRIVKTGGTALNTELQEYTDRFFILMEESWKFGKEEEEAFAQGLTDEEKTDWADRREAILNEIEDNICGYISKNARNALGEQIFLRDAYLIRPEKLNKLIPLFRPEFDGVDDKFRARLTAQEATSPGKKFTDVKGYGLNGREIAFSDFVGKGNVVLIDYWASWCGPCIASLPEIKEFYKKNKDKGLVVIGVSLDSDKDKWAEATKKYDITWPQLSNLKGFFDPAATLYGINGIPETILIDRNGVIVNRSVGNDSRLQSMFDDLIKND